MKSNLEDALITTLISASVDYANGYCKREFGSCDFELLSKDFCFTIPNNPIFDLVVSFHNGTNYTIISSANYVLDYTCAEPKIVFLEGFTIPELKDRPDAVKVTYKGGFTDETLPESVKVAMMMKLATIYDQRAEENKRFLTTADVLLNPYKVYTV